MIEKTDCLTGPETEVREQYLSMRAKIAGSPNVHEVVALSILPTEGKWLYLVKTCFATWPKYVVGLVNEDNTAAEILLKCQLREQALSEFNEQNFGDHL